MAPKLTLAIADHDLNHALIDGLVRTESVDLEVIWDLEDGERHARMLKDRAFDACEFSFAGYLVGRSRGWPYRGIPAFPNRKFRHSYIFCNTSAGIEQPKDLEGKRVGLRAWSATASVWVRGILRRFYDVDLARITWFGEQDPQKPAVPPEITLHVVERGADLDTMLVAGELDAVIYPDVLPSIQEGRPEVKRLFEDYKAAEQEFYRRTRIFPISHLVVVSEELAEESPQVALDLLQAFRKSRDLCFHRLEEQQILSVSWAGELLAEQRALMGPNYWPYNVADNRLAIETLVGFAHEQGLIPEPFPVEDLFLPQTLAAEGA